jgi:hypothetical protein
MPAKCQVRLCGCRQAQHWSRGSDRVRRNTPCQAKQGGRFFHAGFGRAADPMLAASAPAAAKANAGSEPGAAACGVISPVGWVARAAKPGGCCGGGDGLRTKAGQVSFGNRSTRLPRRKSGSIVPPRERVTVGNVLQSFVKFGAAEPWVPAFAGKAEAEAANFPSRSGFLPSLKAQPILRLLALNHAIASER